MPGMTKNSCDRTFRVFTAEILIAFEKRNTGQGVYLPGERRGMEPVTMTPEELAEYLDKMPENMILRVTVQEDSHEPENDEEI